MKTTVSDPGGSARGGTLDRTGAKGMALVLVCLFFLSVALVLGSRPLYVMFAAMVAAPLLSYAIGRTSLRQLRIERRMATHMSEGQVQAVHLDITNTGRLRKFYACLVDELPEWFLSSAPEGHLVADLGAGETVRVTYNLTALKRGVHRIGPVRLRAGDPTGLFDYRLQTTHVTEVVVYPVGGRLPALSFGQGTPFAAAALGRRPVAEGTDFRSIREYTPGDPLRRIHWKSSAHAGKFNVIEFEESLASDVAVVLDLTAGSEVGADKDTTLEYGIKIAVAVAEHALGNRSSCRLTARAAVDRSVNCRNMVRDLPRLLETLARAEADCPEPFPRVLDVAAAHLGRGAALMIITPCTDPEIVGAVRGLVVNGVSVHVLCLRADTFAEHAGMARHGIESTAQYASFVSEIAASGATVREITCGSNPIMQIGGR